MFSLLKKIVRLIIILSTRFLLFEHSYANFSLCPDKKTVAIIVPCFNYLKYTRQAILSYYKSIDSRYNYVLVLIDDHSSDKTESFFFKKKSIFKNFCYFRYKKNMGITQIWNNGIRFAIKILDANYIFLMNNDIIIATDTIGRIIEIFKNNKHIGVAGPLTNSSITEDAQEIRSFYPNYSPTDSWKDIQKVNDFIKQNKPFETSSVNGFFWGLTREALERNVFVSFPLPYYFNPLHKSTGNEYEFQGRFKKTGLSIFVASNAFVFHYKDVTERRFNKETKKIYRKWHGR